MTDTKATQGRSWLLLVCLQSPKSSYKKIYLFTERKRLRGFSEFILDILTALPFFFIIHVNHKWILLIQYFVLKSFIQAQQGHKAFRAGKLFTINLGMLLLNLPELALLSVCILPSKEGNSISYWCNNNWSDREGGSGRWGSGKVFQVRVHFSWVLKDFQSN